AMEPRAALRRLRAARALADGVGKITVAGDDGAARNVVALATQHLLQQDRRGVAEALVPQGHDDAEGDQDGEERGSHGGDRSEQFHENYATPVAAGRLDLDQNRSPWGQPSCRRVSSCATARPIRPPSATCTT